MLERFPRRWCLALLLAAGAGCVAGSGAPEPGMEPATELGPPNIVMIVTEGQDDRRTESGAPLVSGRTLGSLPATSPVSAVTWASLLTGLPPRALGLHDGEDPVGSAADSLRGVPPGGVRVFPELLRRAGYYTVRSGPVRHTLVVSPPVGSTRRATDRPPGPLGAWDAAGPGLDWSREPGDPCAVAFGCGDYTGEPTGPFFVLFDLVGDPDRGPRVSDLLARLEADGVADETVIVRVGLDGASPVVVSASRPVGSGAGESPDLVRVVDVAPTILGLAGAPIPDVMPGRNLLDSTTGPVDPGGIESRVEPWDDGVPPVAATPTGYPTGGVFHIAPRVELSCDTPDSTIVYTTELEPPYHWRLYRGPFRMRFWKLRFQCGRLGYADSPVVTYDFDIE